MINSKQSFLDYDMSKAFAGFAMPSFNVEAMMASQRKNVEALTQANQLAIEGAQALARRQVEIAREALEEARSLFREFSQPGAPQERLAKNTEIAKATFEKGLATAKELTELVTKANAEAFDVLTKRVAESFEEIREVASTKAA
ncbi:MAG TPA: TIGR01841 family phasin [Stellaceae bacterium]|nr:TIGR01841 family phasin [Stellaceae bacterium]